MYERHILRILYDVGERGISVRLLAKHVYNLSTSLFSQPDLKAIHRYVQQYLYRNSRSPQAIIASAGRWGCYCLNTKGSKEARRIASEIRREKASPESEEASPPARDLSLSLFD